MDTDTENESLHDLENEAVNASTKKPSVETVKIIDQVQNQMGDLGAWLAQARSNEENMLALWDGQSEDGRKWGKNYAREVFPWEGAADTRVRLIDAAVDETSQLCMMAFFSANLRVMAMEAGDIDAAGRVQTLLNYEVKQRLNSELWREMNFLTQWTRFFGHAIIHTSWKREFTTGRETLTEQDLAELLASEGLLQLQAETGAEPDEQTAALISEASTAEIMDALESGGRGAELEALISRRYPMLGAKRIKQIIKDMRAEGVAEFRLPVEKPGRPCVRALTPGIDVIYPAWCDDVRDAPWVAMVCRIGEPELRAKARTDDWDPEFVDAMITAGPSPVMDVSILERNLSAQVNRVQNRGIRAALQSRLDYPGDCYEYLHVYVKMVDEDGIEGMQEIVMRPDLKDKQGHIILALDRLNDYWHEGGCFVDFRRDWKTRSLWQTRGEPELANTAQWEVKSLRDSRMDRTSLATLPPLRVNPKRIAGGSGKWDIKPGMKIPNGPNDETSFLTVPNLDSGNLEMEASIRRDHCNLLGLEHPDLPPSKIQIHRQWIVNGFLIQCREVLQRILALDQQYMSPVQVSRVIGSGPMPYTVTREEIAGQYDLALHFDVRSLDTDYVKERWAAINEALNSDRSGALNDVVLTRWKLASIDPNLADLAMVDMQSKNKNEVEEERTALAKLMLGMETVPPEGANARVRLEALQGEIQRNPKAAAQYQQDAMFQEQVNARLTKWEFDLTQMDNARIGATGWEPAAKPPTASEQLAGGMQEPA